jgi:hypothetical protein
MDPNMDPDSEYGSGSGSTDLIECGSNPDPDPKPWLEVGYRCYVPVSGDIAGDMTGTVLCQLLVGGGQVGVLAGTRRLRHRVRPAHHRWRSKR